MLFRPVSWISNSVNHGIRKWPRATQAAVTVDRQILGCRHADEIRNILIQVAMVVDAENVLLDVSVEGADIDNAARGRVRLAGDGDMQDVIVAVTIGMIALSVEHLVLRVGELRGMEAVRCGETVYARESHSWAPCQLCCVPGPA